MPTNQINVSVEETKLVLVASEESNLSDVIHKLHKQFAHPSAKRLKSLLQDAGGKQMNI